MQDDRPFESNPETLDFVVGWPLVTADGHTLGTVREVRGAYLLVDAPRRPDYWLSGEYVVQTSPDGTILSFNEADLDQYRLDEPGPEPSQDPLREAAVEPVVDSEPERLEQRKRMVEELARQRQELPHEHPAGGDLPPDTHGTVGEPVEAELPRLEAAIAEEDGGAETIGSPTGAILPPAEEALPPASGRRPSPISESTGSGLLPLVLAGLAIAAAIALVAGLVRARRRRP